jgi:hypothetical protein
LLSLGVEVKRRLNLRVPKYFLHGLRINLSLIDQANAEAVTQIVKSEAVSVRDSYANRDSSIPQVGPVEDRRADRE